MKFILASLLIVSSLSTFAASQQCEENIAKGLGHGEGNKIVLSILKINKAAAVQLYLVKLRIRKEEADTEYFQLALAQKEGKDSCTFSRAISVEEITELH